MCIIHVVPYVKRVRVGVEKDDASIYQKMIIFFVIIAEKVLNLITGYVKYRE
jgi:hypothetical protein